MRVHVDTGPDALFHLTYCTNIHPGNGWSEVYANLQRYGPALKQRLAPDANFGVGLRLSGKESRELLHGERLQQFLQFLQVQGLYVFTLNGFPYGPFHQLPVKANVYTPDWRDDERVQYTLRLIEILAFLLPDGIEGSISTCPLAYKGVDVGRGQAPPLPNPAMWECLTRNIVHVAEVLVRLKQECDKFICLALEPEPDCLLENSDEVTQFYTRWLLTMGAEILASALAISKEKACSHLLEHIRVCLDTCHLAVAYEEPVVVLERFERIGIKVGKVQLSSALKITFPDDELSRAEISRALEPFAESTYLHQVVQQNRDGTFERYPDLVMPCASDCHMEQWRVHFHVPIFIGQFSLFQSTQDVIIAMLKLLMQKRFCRHLEIETYTWNVLPGELKIDVASMIAREYEWVLGNLL
ncbi:MAG TPA: metabolite traffic protein EboE [Ktedonobacteraceae bacterium]|nr:metabolite traffic protein EboE [Ktedonobacteraceae bacterium]